MAITKKTRQCVGVATRSILRKVYVACCATCNAVRDRTETVTVATVAELRNGKQSLYVSSGGRKVPAAYLLPILQDADLCDESGMAAQPAKFS